MPQPRTSSFEYVLSSHKVTIDKYIRDYFNSDSPYLGLELSKQHLQNLELLKEFSLRPGKRIRGILTLTSYDNFAKRPNSSVMYACLSIELIQNYLLIIDDVMDQSDKRRNKPTVHQVIKNKNSILTKHTSEMIAINIGLLASHIANVLLTKVDVTSKNSLLALKLLNKNIVATCYGQLDDLYNISYKSTQEQIIKFYEMKNSYYTFINPLQIGAALAGKGTPQALKDLESIGRPAGVAFQLQDDILGMFGAEHKTGKSASDDIKEGKHTLLIQKALVNASQPQKIKIKKTLGNKDIDEKDVDEIRDIVEKTGSRRAVHRLANSFGKISQEKISGSSFLNPDLKEFMNQLIEYTLKRAS